MSYLSQRIRKSKLGLVLPNIYLIPFTNDFNKNVRIDHGSKINLLGSDESTGGLSQPLGNLGPQYVVIQRVLANPRLEPLGLLSLARLGRHRPGLFHLVLAAAGHVEDVLLLVLHTLHVLCE